MAKCDGLLHPCENEATHLVVVEMEPEAVPAIKGIDLCDKCYAEWESWEDGTDDAELARMEQKLEDDAMGYALAYEREQADRIRYDGMSWERAFDRELYDRAERQD